MNLDKVMDDTIAQQTKTIESLTKALAGGWMKVWPQM